MGFPGGSAMQEMRVGSLGREDPLEEGMATHSSILAWRILQTEEPGGLQSMGSPSRKHAGRRCACTPFYFPLCTPKPGLTPTPVLLAFKPQPQALSSPELQTASWSSAF